MLISSFASPLVTHPSRLHSPPPGQNLNALNQNYILGCNISISQGPTVEEVCFVCVCLWPQFLPRIGGGGREREDLSRFSVFLLSQLFQCFRGEKCINCILGTIFVIMISEDERFNNYDKRINSKRFPANQTYKHPTSCIN